MIIVIQGKPGDGKTLYTMSEIAKEFDGRAIYYQGIEGVTRENWIEIPDPREWINLPEGAVLIVDEAHKVFTKRPPSQVEPPHVQAMAEHRHKGIDVVLVTQDARDLDHFIRRRIGRLVHIERLTTGHKGAWVYEWADGYPEEGVFDYHARQRASRRMWLYPQEVFEMYKSAELHTHKVRIPRGIIRAIGLLVLSVAAVVLGFKMVIGTFAPGGEKSGGETFSQAGYVTASATTLQPRQSLGGMQYLGVDEYIEMRTPRIPDMPESAPIYDELVKPVTAPRPICVHIHTQGELDCRCYTQQATKLQMSDSMCMDIVYRGRFDATYGGSTR